MNENFKSNLIFAFLAQGVSFIFSFIMSLIVPKILGIEEFSYWQLFIFYSGYVGLFHFGLSDGIYLKYGGMTVNQLNKSEIVSQFRLMLLWQFAICIIASPFVISSDLINERKLIILLVGVYLLIANATWFWGYVFQAANQTRIYSISIIISKVFFIVTVILILFLKSDGHIPLIFCYLLTQVLALIYILNKSREFLFAKQLSIPKTIKNTFDSVRIGINLTIANIASSLILGVGRAMLDKTSGIEIFGMISLALSLTTFFLQFISAVSMVLFPALRQVSIQSSKIIFIRLRSWVSYFLCLILIVYIPLKIILSSWLPQYTASLDYMGFLLPICVFDGKMQLIFNTYLNVLRKEKILLIINLITMVLSAVLCAIGAYWIGNILSVALAMTFAIIFRSILANVYLTIQMQLEVDKNIYWELVLVLAFLFLNIYCNDIYVIMIYSALYCAYLSVFRHDVRELLLALRKK